jgi:hypothetical protein
MESLTAIRGFLNTSILDVQYDLSVLQFDTEEQRLKMFVQLQLLIAAKGNLDVLAEAGKDSQIFRSSITF